ncbi:hypothetical protein GCM10010387_13220 [Streptomyces inusitatus]|uniref:Uncharacterized protein n=1 Tax=Streptomyces inusitatus TaxID=68221 RepID=A0A918PST9_9ACTN|nr:hypothetical protein [Streptomyces inusitatus]GGZ21517.1 hypothetical protein GCM10010387_13220 [Streptomyces inusitatus]
MSQQYPGQQPYPNHPGYGPPPPPPKKKLSTGATVAIVLGSVVGFFLILGIIGAALSSSDPTDKKPDTAKAPSIPSAAEKPEKAEKTEKAEKAEAAETAEKPAPAQKSYSNGDYLVGEDIPAGTYTTPGAKKGPFEFCTITTKPAEGEMPQIKSANADERIIITLTKADGVLTVQGCEPLTPRK